jgi:hypothetical protein
MDGGDWYIEFETTQGDELSVKDLKNATWKVVETYLDLDENDRPVFTHRIEVHSIDDLTADGLED